MAVAALGQERGPRGGGGGLLAAAGKGAEDQNVRLEALHSRLEAQSVGTLLGPKTIAQLQQRRPDVPQNLTGGRSCALLSGGGIDFNASPGHLYEI